MLRQQQELFARARESMYVQERLQLERENSVNTVGAGVDGVSEGVLGGDTGDNGATDSVTPGPGPDTESEGDGETES